MLFKRFGGSLVEGTTGSLSRVFMVSVLSLQKVCWGLVCCVFDVQTEPFVARRSQDIIATPTSTLFDASPLGRVPLPWKSRKRATACGLAEPGPPV